MLRDAQYRFSAIAFTAALLLLVAACGPYPRPALGPDFDGGDEPLRVWLTDTPDATPSPFTAFHVNRPAYVAIFDIRPGAGVRAVYPWDASGAGHPVPAGLRSVMPFEAAHGLRPHGFGFGAYGAYGASSFAAFGSCASALHSPVVWRLIIASERPLRLERLVGDVAFSFRPALHTRSFAFGNAFDIMDAIVSRAVPGAMAGGDLASGGQWDVYWTSGWAAGDCRRPLLPLPRLVLGDHPWDGPDPAEGDDGDDEDGLGDGDARVVDGFRVPVATDRPAVAWNGGDEGDASDGASAEAGPTPPALLRGPETRGRAAAARLVEWRDQTGPTFERRDWGDDRDRGFRVRPLRRGWGEIGGGMRFRGHARPDRGHARPDPGHGRRVDSPSPVRRSPPPPRVRRGSDGDSNRADRPTDSGGGN